MQVTRVHKGNSSWVEPPLDPEWDNAMKLEWHAAAVEHDCGVPVKVRPGRSWTNGVPDHDAHSVLVGHSSVVLSFREAWMYLNGVLTGAQQAHREEP